MKNLSDFLIENCCHSEEEEVNAKTLAKKVDELEKRTEDAEKKADDAQAEADKAKKEATKAEESITSVEDFKEYARKKFETVFGDELDEDKMNKVIDGILDKCKDEVDDGDFGNAIGMLNKSFGS